MDISKVVYGIIGIVVAVIVVATVLIPTVDGSPWRTPHTRPCSVSSVP